MELYNFSLEELWQRLEKGEVSSLEVTRSVFRRIAEVDNKVAAYLEIDEKGALAQAEAADERRRKGEATSPVTGIPLGLKDLLSTVG
ncbi:MAG: Asp-tRNA(Asn)/Glu-tRNA(Gln) amidotransferase GatCAB subunit A, partial [Deltaproteobacteria bacterium]|nr:Asp-tRNA(Asn)/Glu-tRNA(Gln) amidotransferase GatCAB subunit A [Deltaproteobacteria bacterium]